MIQLLISEIARDYCNDHVCVHTSIHTTFHTVIHTKSQSLCPCHASPPGACPLHCGVFDTDMYSLHTCGVHARDPLTTPCKKLGRGATPPDDPICKARGGGYPP